MRIGPEPCGPGSLEGLEIDNPGGSLRVTAITAQGRSHGCVAVGRERSQNDCELYPGPLGTCSSMPKMWGLGEDQRHRSPHNIAWRNYVSKMRNVRADQRCDRGSTTHQRTSFRIQTGIGNDIWSSTCTWFIFRTKPRTSSLSTGDVLSALDTSNVVIMSAASSNGRIVKLSRVRECFLPSAPPKAVNQSRR